MIYPINSGKNPMYKSIQNLNSNKQHILRRTTWNITNTFKTKKNEENLGTSGRVFGGKTSLDVVWTLQGRILGKKWPPNVVLPLQKEKNSKWGSVCNENFVYSQWFFIQISECQKSQTKFLDIQKFGWKKDKKSGPKFTAFQNGALSSKGVCISKVFKVYHQFMILKIKDDCL